MEPSLYTSKTVVRVIGMVVMIALFAGSFVGAYRHKNMKVAHSDAVSDIELSDAFGKENLIPMVIVGSGPAGLSAAIYGRRGGLKTVVVEGNEPGGLLTKTTLVENWPGEASILGPDLIDKMHEQAKGFGVAFMVDMVEAIDTTSWPYRVTTQDGTTMHAMSIIIATGATPTKLGIPGEEAYWGHGVTACAICDALFFEGKDVVIVGGGDSAVEQAFQLVPHVKSVTMLVRKDTMRAAASMQERLKKSDKIAVVYNVEPREIIGAEYDEVDAKGKKRHIKKVTHIKLYDAQLGKERLMPTSGVFLAIGHTPNSHLVKDIVDLDKSGFIRVQDKTQATSVKGVFAAGEVEDKRYKQAIVSAGHGASAALDALNFLTDIGYTPGMDMGQDKKSLTTKDTTKDFSSMVFEEIGSKDELDELLANSSTPVLLDFYTPSCASCKHMMPTVAEVADGLQDTIKVFKVDAEQAEDLVKEFDIRRVPTFMMVAQGKSPRTSDKITSKKDLSEFIDEYLAK